MKNFIRLLTPLLAILLAGFAFAFPCVPLPPGVPEARYPFIQDGPMELAKAAVTDAMNSDPEQVDAKLEAAFTDFGVSRVDLLAWALDTFPTSAIDQLLAAASRGASEEELITLRELADAARVRAESPKPLPAPEVPEFMPPPWPR